jgi:hypothetical protein
VRSQEKYLRAVADRHKLGLSRTRGPMPGWVVHQGDTQTASVTDTAVGAKRRHRTKCERPHAPDRPRCHGHAGSGLVGGGSEANTPTGGSHRSRQPRRQGIRDPAQRGAGRRNHGQRSAVRARDYTRAEDRRAQRLGAGHGAGRLGPRDREPECSAAGRAPHASAPPDRTQASSCAPRRGCPRCAPLTVQPTGHRGDRRRDGDRVDAGRRCPGAGPRGLGRRCDRSTWPRDKRAHELM